MQTIRDNLATIVVGILVLVVVVGSCVLFGPWHTNTTTALNAIVHDGDGGERVLSLNQDARVTIATRLGSNTLVVEHGSIRMAKADCPTGSCMKQEAIAHVGEQIICLPHKLWVEISANEDGTGTLDVDAVNWGNHTDSNVDLVAQ